MKLEGKNLFEIEGGCSKDANGKYSNVICLQPGEVKASVAPSELSLWSHVGGAGPFTNSKGIPIDGLPMKCICESVADKVSLSDVTYYSLTAFSPNECQSKGRFFRRQPIQSVSCTGFSVSSMNQNTTILKTSALYDLSSKQGVKQGEIRLLSQLERRQLLVLALPTLYRNLNSVLNRQGNMEWPNIVKWPYMHRDSCAAKNVSSLAYPNTTFPPYVLGGETELTFPVSRSALELCSVYNIGNRFFCPSHQNPTLQNVKYWSYKTVSPQGVFANGTVWKPLGILECLTKCRVRPEGTAYIGNGPHGIVV
jgi:hypothetical protein